MMYLPPARGSLLRQFVGVAAEIGEANDFVPLIVVTEDHNIAAQFFSSGGNPLVHRVIRQDEIIF